MKLEERLERAIVNNKPHIIKKIDFSKIEQSTINYSLTLSIKFSSIDVVSFLIEKGADIRALSGHYLETAALHRKEEIFYFLIENGVDLFVGDKKYATDPRGRYETPLQYASFSSCIPLMDYMLSAGMNLHIGYDCVQSQAIQNAADGEYEVLEYLVTNWLDVDYFLDGDNFYVMNTTVRGWLEDRKRKIDLQKRLDVELTDFKKSTNHKALKI